MLSARAALLRKHAKLLQFSRGRQPLVDCSIIATQDGPLPLQFRRFFRQSATSQFQTSITTSSGKYSVQIPERDRKWRENLSKKAIKRQKRAKEILLRRSKSMPQKIASLQSLNPTEEGDEMSHRNNLRMPSKLTTGQKKSLKLPSSEELAQRSKENRIVLESMLELEPQAATPIEELKKVDADAWVSAMRSGEVAPIESNWNYAIRAYGAQGNFPGALAAFRELQKSLRTQYLIAKEQLLSLPPEDIQRIVKRKARNSRPQSLLPEGNANAGSPDPSSDVSTSKIPSHTKVHSASHQPMIESLLPVPFPSEHTCTALLAACAHQRNLPAAQEVWTQFRSQGVQPSIPMYGAYIQAHIRSFDLEGAFTLLAEAEKEGLLVPGMHDKNAVGPQIFTQLIVGCVKEGLYERAEETFHHMRTFYANPDEVAFNAVITAAGRRDQVEKVLNYLIDMRMSGLIPTHVTYNTAIHACGRSNRKFEEAFPLFEEMKVNGLQRDVRTYNAVLLACSHTGHVEKARQYMAQMLREGIRPNIYTFNTLLTVYARALLPRNLRRQTSGGSSLSETLTARQSGVELLALDEKGALSDPALAKRDLKTQMHEQLQTKGDMKPPKAARLVEPLALDSTVEKLLADYFGVSETHPGMQDSDDEDILREEEPGYRPKDASSIRELQQSGALLDVQDPAYQRMKQSLLEGGIVDEELFRDIEEEAHRYPADDSDEEEKAARKYAEREARRLRKFQQEAMELARREKELKEEMIARERQMFDGTVREAGNATQYTTLQDVLQSHTPNSTSLDIPKAPTVSTSTSGSIGATNESNSFPSSLQNSNLPAIPTTSSSFDLISSASLILQNHSSGQGRMSMRKYLAALEKEVMEGLFGPEFDSSAHLPTSSSSSSPSSATDSSSIAIASPPVDPDAVPSALRNPRWVPIFGALSPLESERRRELYEQRVKEAEAAGLPPPPPDATGYDYEKIGGMFVKDLLDPMTVPIPANALGGEFGLQDHEALEEYVQRKIQIRVQQALSRELVQQYKELPEMVEYAQKYYENPYLSDSLDEYLYSHSNDTEDSIKSDSWETRVLQRLEANENDACSEGGTEGEVQGISFTKAQSRNNKPVPVQSPASARTTASSHGDTELQNDAFARTLSRLPDVNTLDPIQRARRSVGIRVLHRLLGAVSTTELDLLLLQSTEQVDKRRKRQYEGGSASLLDSLFAVRRLQAVRSEVDSTAEQPLSLPDFSTSAVSPPMSSTASSNALLDPVISAVAPANLPFDPKALHAAGSYVPPAPSELYAMAAKKHSERQTEAMSTLSNLVESEESARGRLQGLVELADAVFTGAEWQPMDLPTLTPAMRKAMLLEEARRIYTSEMVRYGEKPDDTTLNVMVNILAQHDADRAMEFLRAEFPKYDQAPNNRTFRPLLRHYAMDKKQLDKAEVLFQAMRELHIQPDAESYGMIVHAMAREWRIKDALTVVRDMKEEGLQCPEVYATLLRQRCKELNIFHPDVPEHPHGWQFDPKINEKRAKGKSTEIRKQWKAGLRIKLGKYR